MKYLHTMIRVSNLEETIRFFNVLGLKETRRHEVPKGKFTLVFLATEDGAPEVELTHNWDETDTLSGDRNFGHIAYSVENIYEICQKLQDAGITILRPPRDGRMAFVRTPDQISIELLQEGDALEVQEPWSSMPNQGEF